MVSSFKPRFVSILSSATAVTFGAWSVLLLVTSPKASVAATCAIGMLAAPLFILQIAPHAIVPLGYEDTYVIAWRAALVWLVLFGGLALYTQRVVRINDT